MTLTSPAAIQRGGNGTTGAPTCPLRVLPRTMAPPAPAAALPRDARRHPTEAHPAGQPRELMEPLDVLVAGIGFAGSTCARVLAEAGLRVHLVDRRRHIGG